MKLHWEADCSGAGHLTSYAQMEILSKEERDAELESAIRACFETLLPTLKAEYSEILQRVDLQGTPPGDAARDLGLTPNNLRVRLHRARLASPIHVSL